MSNLDSSYDYEEDEPEALNTTNTSASNDLKRSNNDDTVQDCPIKRPVDASIAHFNSDNRDEEERSDSPSSRLDDSQDHADLHYNQTEDEVQEQQASDEIDAMFGTISPTPFDGSGIDPSEEIQLQPHEYEEIVESSHPKQPMQHQLQYAPRKDIPVQNNGIDLDRSMQQPSENQRHNSVKAHHKQPHCYQQIFDEQQMQYTSQNQPARMQPQYRYQPSYQQAITKPSDKTYQDNMLQPQQRVFRVEPVQKYSYSTSSQQYQPIYEQRQQMQQQPQYQHSFGRDYASQYNQQPHYEHGNSYLQEPSRGDQPLANEASLPSPVPSRKSEPHHNATNARKPKTHYQPIDDPALLEHGYSVNKCPPSDGLDLSDDYHNFYVRSVVPQSFSKVVKTEEGLSRPITVKGSGTTAIDSTAVFTVASHVGKKHTIKVTKDEIRRRMGAPEYQDFKIIQRLMRHARTSSGTFENKLMRAGFLFDLCPVQRPINTIEMLLEDDAVLLATDFNKITSTYLCKWTLAAIAMGKVNQYANQIGYRAPEIMELLMCAKQHLLRFGRDPSSVQFDNNCPEARAVGKFSLETHGFGPLAAVAVIESLMKMVSVFMTEDGRGKMPQANFEQHAPIIAGKTGTEIDHSLLAPLPDDLQVYEKSVLPRIGYDVEYIEITIGELRRRIQGPEKFTPSLLSGFLRKEKITGSLPDLRQAMHNCGIPFDVASKHKKSTIQSSAWTSLAEKECMDLANETGSFLSRLPASKEMIEKATMLPGATAWLKYMAGLIKDSTIKIGIAPEQRSVETVAEMHLLRYAMITHHFGHAFYASVLTWLQTAMFPHEDVEDMR